MSTPEHGITPLLTPEEPWMGLVSYRQEDQGLFFGRTREADELLRMIQREALTVVFGPSGTGKTSLLNAGVFPKLNKAEAFLPIYIRLDHNPGSLPADRQIRARIDTVMRENSIEESSLLEDAGQPPSSPEQESVWEYLHRVEFWNWQNYPVTPVLFFDQFEEAFTLGSGRPETKKFFTELADLVENYTPVLVREYLTRTSGILPYPSGRRYKIVISLREDFVHTLDRLRKLMPSIMQNRFCLTRMNGTQGMEVVLGPGSHLVTEEVATQIIRFVSSGQSAEEEDSGAGSELARLEVEPALLSVVCRELNHRRLKQGTPRITEEQVRQSGADVLKDFYERSFEGIPAEARHFVEDRLLTGSGFRSTAPEEDAIKLGISSEVIRKLEDRRIIRREQRLRIAHIELTHDLLCTVVKESRSRREARRKEEQEEAARRSEKERNRLMRKVIIALSTLLLIALGMMVFALVQRNEAIQAKVQVIQATEQAMLAKEQEIQAKVQAKKSLEVLAVTQDIQRQAAQHANNAGILSQRGKYNEAVIEYDKAIKLDPDNPAHYDNKGFVLIRAKQYAEAINVLETLIVKAPQYPLGHYNLARAYYESGGRESDALKEATKVLEIDRKYCKAFGKDTHFDWFKKSPEYLERCPEKTSGSP